MLVLYSGILKWRKWCTLSWAWLLCVTQRRLLSMHWSRTRKGKLGCALSIKTLKEEERSNFENTWLFWNVLNATLPRLLLPNHPLKGNASRCFWLIRELKQQRRRRLQKGHSKPVFALPQTLSLYSISFDSSNVGKCFWSWILKDCIKVLKKKKNVVVFCSTRPRQNVKLGTSRSSRATTPKKCTKKRDARRAKLLFC